MYTAWDLPGSLSVGGRDYRIRTDFRACLDALRYLSDPEYEDDEKTLIFLDIMYPELAKIPKKHYKEAIEKASKFLDAGIENDSKSGRKKPTVMDWAQDSALIIPAVNRVLGQEVRAIPWDPITGVGLHWWTFLGAYLEIGESLYATVLDIRTKRAKGKKLEKYEMDFYRENQALVDIRRNKRENSEEQKNAARELIFGHKKQHEK